MSNVVEVYISVDIEADGPIPGPYSMTSLGATVAGWRYDTGEYAPGAAISDPEDMWNFYAEIRPISEQWRPEAFAVGLLNCYPEGTDLEQKRKMLELRGLDADDAMHQFANWVDLVKGLLDAKGAVFCAYPLGFDWLFTYWCMENFAWSPFGHSRHIDIKTLYMAKAKQTVSRSVKSNMPKSLRPAGAHTHNALDDAIEQGQLLMNILNWEGK